MPQVQVSRVNINSYLLQLEQNKFSGGQIVAYSARGYPIAFYHYLAAYVAQLIRLPLRVYAENDVEGLIGSLSMSFLGSAFLYFVPDISIFSLSDRKKLEAFLAKYSGEHAVVVANSAGVWAPDYAVCTVDFEDKVGPEEANVLARLFFAHYWQKDERTCFVRPVLLSDFVVSCLARVLSADMPEEAFQGYLARVSGNQGTVFSLAQCWLGKDVRGFGSLWRIMGPMYPVEYWVSFFSDLLWQASYCVEQEGQALERALSNRLPFSFIKRDWRLYSIRELASAHAYLYLFDWQIKHGGSLQQLDLFITKFVCGQFGPSSR